MTEPGNTIPPVPNPTPPTTPTTSNDSQDFVQALKHAVEFFKLDFTHLKTVADDPKMPLWVIIILAISGVASAIGSLNILGIFVIPFLSIIFGSLFIVFFWVIAGPIMGGKASILQHYNTLGLLSVVQWISVIPFLGPFISLILSFYMIFVYQKMIKILHELSEGKAWIVVLIPVVIGLIIALILAMVFGLAILGIASAVAAGN
jgi:hypothetical protein